MAKSPLKAEFVSLATGLRIFQLLEISFRLEIRESGASLV